MSAALKDYFSEKLEEEPWRIIEATLCRIRRGVIFFQTLSAFGNPLDLFDQSLLLDMLFLGAPSCVLGWDFYFFSKCLL